MASKADIIKHFSARVKELEKEIEETKIACEQITASMNAILFEVCEKYGSQKKKRVKIGFPRVDKIKGKHIIVDITDEGYLIYPVSIDTAEDE